MDEWANHSCLLYRSQSRLEPGSKGYLHGSIRLSFRPLLVTDGRIEEKEIHSAGPNGFTFRSAKTAQTVPLLLVMQHASDEIRRYDKRIEKLAAEKYPQTKRMRSARRGAITFGVLMPCLAFFLALNIPGQKHLV